jgi:hypothetical protein
MERAVVVGNCQAPALEIMLSTNDEFGSRFEFVSFPPVHEIPDAMVSELHGAVADAGLVILQRIDDGYREGVGLGTETLAAMAATANVVRWPSVYWAGYFPDLFYLRDVEGRPVVDGPFDYHDRTVLRAYNGGKDVACACSLLEDSGQPSDAQAWAEKATAELDVRGQGCDVQIASFIASRFREELLFFTMNHPANRLMGFIAEEISDLIGISGRVDYRHVQDEVLGSTFYPLHANHVRALDLRFGAECEAGHVPFRIRGTAFEPEHAVEAFFNYYAAHPQLVELNLDPHEA